MTRTGNLFLTLADRMAIGSASIAIHEQEVIRMNVKLLSVAALMAVSGIICVGHSSPLLAASASLTALDPDNDGTIDIPEAKAAGAKLFAKLDPDDDGTLDAKELSGRVDEASLKAADPDSDGTVDQKEYDALVEARFKAADPDNDGTLDDNELTTDAGKSFLLLVE